MIAVGMAKTPRKPCAATTAKGTPCKRMAYKGETLCGLHMDKEDYTRLRTESRARPKPEVAGFHPGFQDILDWVKDLKADPPDNLGTLVNLGRLQLAATEKALEHQRLLDGIGAGAVYNFTMQPPAERDPVEVPSEAIEGGDEGRVLN